MPKTKSIKTKPEGYETGSLGFGSGPLYGREPLTYLRNAIVALISRYTRECVENPYVPRDIVIVTGQPRDGDHSTPVSALIAEEEQPIGDYEPATGRPRLFEVRKDGQVTDGVKDLVARVVGANDNISLRLVGKENKYSFYLAA